MPSTRIASRNGSASNSDTMTARSRPRRLHSIMAETDRHVVKPAKRAVKSASRSVKRTVSGFPGWIPWVLGSIAVGGLIYGLMQLDFVQDFLSGSDDFDAEDEDYFTEDSWEGSDYGERESG